MANNATVRDNNKVVATNRQARYNYFIFDCYEAGIELHGCEVKSLREGRANLRDSFVRFLRGEAYVFNLHISLYSHSQDTTLEPTRTRKLLLRKSEIHHLEGKVSQKGFSCIPLRIYFKRGLAKLEIALCQGKKLHDKREALREKVRKRETDRALSAHQRKKTRG